MAVKKQTKKKGANKKKGEKGTNLRPSVKFDAKRRAEFIGIVSRTGRRVAASRELGVCYATVCQHQNKDSEFASAIAEAIDIYRDSIDEEVGRRGMKGIEEDIWYQGVIVGKKIVYSDQLLLAHAKAHHPAYKDKVEQDVTVQGVISMGLDELTTEDRTSLRELLRAKAKKAEKEET